MSYEIRRVYANLRGSDLIKTVETLEEAQEHCTDPETSSRTCKEPENVARTERVGAWFDCYTEV